MIGPTIVCAGMFLTLLGSVHVEGVSGAWTVTITSADRSVTGKASLTQDGDKVTGWVGPSETDPIPVDGTVRDNHVTPHTHPQEGRNVAFARCDLTLEGDRMTGTIDSDKGTIEFVRVVGKTHP